MIYYHQILDLYTYYIYTHVSMVEYKFSKKGAPVQKD